MVAGSQDSARRAASLEVVQEELLAVGRQIADDVGRVAKTAAMIDLELGRRRRPGRPRAMDSRELRRALRLRDEGKSWAQTLLALNATRQESDVPALSPSTLRTAVAETERPFARTPARRNRNARSRVP